MYYAIYNPTRLLWVALAKETPFFNKDDKYIPGEMWYIFGETLDEVLSKLKIHFPLCKDWVLWGGEKTLFELGEAHRAYHLNKCKEDEKRGKNLRGGSS